MSFSENIKSVRRLFGTLLFWQLEYNGVSKFYVKNKRVSTVENGHKHYIFIVESEDKKLEGNIEVLSDEFYNFKKGDYYRELGVIRKHNNEKFLLLTKRLDKKGTLFREWLKALIFSIFFLFGLLMAFYTISLLVSMILLIIL